MPNISRPKAEETKSGLKSFKPGKLLVATPRMTLGNESGMV